MAAAKIIIDTAAYSLHAGEVGGQTLLISEVSSDGCLAEAQH